MLYQYIGLEHTMISIVKGEPKVKVVNGEIIESDLEEKFFLRNRFQKIDDTTPEVTPEVTDTTPLLDTPEDEKKENEETAEVSEKTEEKPLENDVKTEDKVEENQDKTEEKPKITTKK